ncbi:S49 family peptidase [Candidatus Leptofilum sp.]|uniref:S49 family peptidase n=1 Tax=Candidatus Leptofilum sp. TaxID=3241576 RepID=UPI003B5C3341
MVQNDGNGRSPLRYILLFLVVVVVPLAIGLFMAPRLLPKPQIGVIRLNYDISNFTAFEFREQLLFARNDPAIKAVVIVINSPGGTASDSEDLYMDVLAARQDLPVVSTVDFLAASGAYYIAAATDAIYAKPGSAIGSIGVISSLPDTPFIEEEVLTTGPYKSFGGTRDGFVRRAETLKFAFLQAVANGRGDQLNADLDLLSRAEIFDGVRALELGLIDGIISTSEAFDAAAELAGLRNYEVVELYPLTFGQNGSVAFGTYQVPAIDQEKLWATPADLPPGLYYRYIELPANQ